MRLQLMRLEFRLAYKPGRELYIADTLSRAPSSRLYKTDVTQHREGQVHSILDQVIPLATTRSRWVAATEADDPLGLIKAILIAGWPEKKNLCPTQALRARSTVYWPGCDDQIRNMMAICPPCQQ